MKRKNKIFLKFIIICLTFNYFNIFLSIKSDLKIVQQSSINNIVKTNVKKEINIINNLNDGNMISFDLIENKISSFDFNKNEYFYREFDNNNLIFDKIECEDINKLTLENNTYSYTTGNSNLKNTISNKIGKVISTFEVYNIKNKAYEKISLSSTGFLMGPDIILTAGHSVFSNLNIYSDQYDIDVNKNIFASEVYFVANNLDGSSSEYKVTKLFIETNYYNGNNKDWALLKLDNNIGNKLGWFGILNNFNKINYDIELYGLNEETNSINKKIGKLLSKNNNNYKTNIKTVSGNSGSPYIIDINNNKYVVGIHNSIELDIKDEFIYSNGAVIDDFIMTFINSFNTNDLIFDINQKDYGFEDSYPIDDYTKTNFTSHKLENGLDFRTRRYRTGYIHNEYIVMSPIRHEIKERKAFIEYNFNRPIAKIEVELSMWRDSKKEILTLDNGYAAIETLGAYEWTKVFDLLSIDNSLPIDRANPKTYTIKFDNPVYNFRFYSAYNGYFFIGDANRGRICIGNIRIFQQKNSYMPLSYSELEFNRELWNNENVKHWNCYAYTLNNQIHPETNNIWHFQQPGEYSNNKLSVINANILIDYTTFDFSKYSIYKNKIYEFKKIDKYEQCPGGSYKVALIYKKIQTGIDYQYDYHWFRQDYDGYWSHKFANKEIERLSYNDKLIKDPENYKIPGYNYFVGYFSLTPWSNYYEKQ